MHVAHIGDIRQPPIQCFSTLVVSLLPIKELKEKYEYWITQKKKLCSNSQTVSPQAAFSVTWRHFHCDSPARYVRIHFSLFKFAVVDVVHGDNIRRSLWRRPMTEPVNCLSRNQCGCLPPELTSGGRKCSLRRILPVNLDTAKDELASWGMKATNMAARNAPR